MRTIDVSDIAFSYGAEPTFAGVSFSVGSGESVALMGVSGSGKSTLLRCLAGLVSPTGGTIRVGNTELSSASSSERARLRLTSIGVVTQAGDLLPELSVHENVALPLLLAGTPRSDALQRAAHALESLGVGELLGRGTWEVSGGQYHRVALARALVIEPSVILGDEPTGALDADTAAEVIEILLSLSERGIAIVIATHDPDVASRCDRVATLRRGALSFDAA